MPSVALYNKFVNNFIKGKIPFAEEAINLKALLTTSAYTFDKSHATIADITNEVTGSGYTSGGISVAYTSEYDILTEVERIYLDPIIFTGINVSGVRCIVIYSDDPGGPNDYLIRYMRLDQDVNIGGTPLRIVFNSPITFSITNQSANVAHIISTSSTSDISGTSVSRSCTANIVSTSSSSASIGYILNSTANIVSTSSTLASVIAIRNCYSAITSYSLTNSISSTSVERTNTANIISSSITSDAILSNLLSCTANIVSTSNTPNVIAYISDPSTITLTSDKVTGNVGDTIVFTATATANGDDPSRSISKVELLGLPSSPIVDTTSPYVFNWTVVVGSYSVTARSTDNVGNTSVSSSIGITGTQQTLTPILSESWADTNVGNRGWNGVGDSSTPTIGTSTTAAGYNIPTTADSTINSKYLRIRWLTAGDVAPGGVDEFGHTLPGATQTSQGSTGTGVTLHTVIRTTADFVGQAYNGCHFIAFLQNLTSGYGVGRSPEQVNLDLWANASPYTTNKGFAQSAGSYGLTFKPTYGSVPQFITANTWYEILWYSFPNVVANTATGSVKGYYRQYGSTTWTLFINYSNIIVNPDKDGYLTHFVIRPNASGGITNPTAIDIGWINIYSGDVLGVLTNTQPSVSISSLSSFIKGTVQLTSTVSNITGTATVSYYRNGTLIGSSSTSPSYPVNFNTSSVTDGSYTITASITDNSGTYNNTNSVTTTVDNTSPIIGTLSISPTTNPIVASGAYTLSVSASDSGSGVKQIDYYLDGSLLGSNTVSPFSYNWAVTSINNGSKSITAYVIDNAGNSSSVSNTLTVTVNISSSVSVTRSWEGLSVTGTSVPSGTGDNYSQDNTSARRCYASATTDPYSLSGVGYVYSGSRSIRHRDNIGNTQGLSGMTVSGTTLSPAWSRSEGQELLARCRYYIPSSYPQVSTDHGPKFFRLYTGSSGVSNSLDIILGLGVDGSSNLEVSPRFQGSLSGTSSIDFWIGGSTLGINYSTSSTPYLIRGQWNKVEVYFKHSTSSGIFKVWINNVLCWNVTGIRTDGNYLAAGSGGATLSGVSPYLSIWDQPVTNSTGTSVNHTYEIWSDDVLITTDSTLISQAGTG